MRKVKHRKRAKPGAQGKGKFFHIEVRPSRLFESFRVHDVGARAGVERIAGRRADGSWETQKWLIEKTGAHCENGTLVADSAGAQKVLAGLGSRPVHIGGDRFKAKPRHNVPEAEKPTAAMRHARLRNIAKAQQTRRARGLA